MEGQTPQALMSADMKSTPNSGIIRVGTVSKIFPKRYSCEVTFETTGEQVLSDSADEGKFGAPVVVSFAGYSEAYKKAYGEIVPLHVGERVVVGMTGDGDAVILGRLHINNEMDGENQEMNILNFSHDTAQYLNDWVKIYPNQDFFIRRENGDWEFSQSNHSFIECKKGFIASDYEDYTNLSVNDKNGDTLALKAENWQPTAYFLSLVSSFTESISQHIKVYIEGMRSVFKIIQHIGGTVSYMRFWKDGSISIRRQLDTIETEGDTPSWNFADITFTPDKTIYIRVCGEHNTIINLNDDGLSVFTDDNIMINAEGNIAMRSKGNTAIYANGTMDIHSDGDMNINTNSNFTTHAIGAAIIKTDSSFDTESATTSCFNAGGNMILNTDANMIQQAGASCLRKAGGSMKDTAATIDHN